MKRGFYTYQDTYGFSIIELAAIVTITAGLAAAFMAWNQPSVFTDAKKKILTQERISVISSAIERFRIYNERLPCPSDPFTREDGTRSSTGSNYGADTYVNDWGEEDLDRNQGDGTLGIDCQNLFKGTVPVRALGLTREYYYDGWGNAFTYTPSANLCGSNAAANIGCTAFSYSNNDGNFTIEDTSSNTITTEAAYVIISHGPNSNGAISSGGFWIANATGDELENADFSVDYDSYSDTTFIKDFATASFDDIVFFRTKDQIEYLAVDRVSKIVDVTTCNTNSSTINAINKTEAIDMDTHIDDYEQGSPVSNEGEMAVFTVMWELQALCVEYYGNTADVGIGWNGPFCPSGSTYDTTTDDCVCYNGDWDGGC